MAAQERRARKTKFHPRVSAVEFKARTPAQDRLIHACETQDIVFAIGPAGTGKTFVTSAYAALALRDQSISRIILTRPAVEAGEKLGYLPGEITDKIGPYLRPYKDVFTRILGRGDLESQIGNHNIEGIAFAHLQGLTFDNSIILVDEAENTDPRQMELVLTRVGENSKIFISGDVRQTYIKGQNGLDDAINTLRHANVPGVAVVDFAAADVVRSDLCRRVVAAYERHI